MICLIVEVILVFSKYHFLHTIVVGFDESLPLCQNGGLRFAQAVLLYENGGVRFDESQQLYGNGGVGLAQAVLLYENGLVGFHEAAPLGENGGVGLCDGGL